MTAMVPLDADPRAPRFLEAQRKGREFLSSRLIRFALVGGTAASAYVVFAGIAAAHWPDHRQLIGVAVCLAIAPLAFLAQRRLAFRSNGEPWPEFARYLLLQLGCITCASLVVPRLAGDAAALNFLVYAANAVLSAGISFVVCTIFVFGRKRWVADGAPLSRLSLRPSPPTFSPGGSAAARVGGTNPGDLNRL